ncbi:MAG: PAS domain S-box protein [Alteromonadaceae bacterium]|nr:PAS domain S-box protein [Alteromonadaceae bacterium]
MNLGLGSYNLLSKHSLNNLINEHTLNRLKPVGLITLSLDEEGKILSVNQAFLSLFGLQSLPENNHIEDVCPNLNWQELVDQGTANKAKSHFLFTASSGVQKHLEVSLCSSETNEGEYDVFAIDVSEQKQEVSTLQTRLDNFEVIPRLELTCDGRFLDCNAKFSQLTAHQAENLQSVCPSQFLSLETGSVQSIQDLVVFLNKKSGSSIELKITGAMGNPIFCQAIVDSVPFDQQGNTKLILLLVDVTRAKMSSAFYQAQLDGVTSAQALLSIDLCGNVIDANSHFEMLYGSDLSELRGKLFEDILSDTSDQSFSIEALMSGEKINGEFAFLKHDDTGVFWLQASFCVIKDLMGTPLSVMCSGIDITRDKMRNADYQGQLEAIHRVQAVAEYSTDGSLVTANQLFLDALGYSLSQIVGESHSIFLPKTNTSSEQEQEFWQELRSGNALSGEYKRITQSGEEVWFQATYNPVLGLDGNIVKIVEYASVITDHKKLINEFVGQADACDKALCMIEFDLNGIVTKANDNGINLINYAREDVVGKSWQALIDPLGLNGFEQDKLWGKLCAGDFDTGEYRLLSSDRKTVWVQGTWNPIKDLNGHPYKIILYCNDISEQAIEKQNSKGYFDAINRAQATIEFELDGTIKSANDLFLQTTGYELTEIVGQHHSMFVTEEYGQSEQYQSFWEQLRAGEFVQGEFQRVNKSGQDIWISATYNPIFNEDGKVVKVVKFASDITSRVNAVLAVKKHLTRLAEGDLSQTIDIEFSPEYQELKDSSNHVVKRLAEIFASVNVSLADINTGSEELSANTDELHSRTEIQASSIEETAVSMEQMTSLVKSNAEQSNASSESARETNKIAKDSQQELLEAVETMSEIREFSSKINEIIGIIDGIAFQTNLLALNAAVEAARAGEAGRGFAVVSAEVRNLALQTASSAKDIKELIQQNHEKISLGSEQVYQSGENIGQIVTKIEKLSEVINDFAVAADEQASGIEEINCAVASIENMVQQNATMVEHSKTICTAQQKQTGEAAELISYFRF